jgi:RNA polymerase sigma-70 factor (family 1)
MFYSKLIDEDLFSLLKDSDEKAFTEIYNRYWALLYSHARQMLRDDDEAMDVVQDVFTVFWRKAEEITIVTSLKSYLYTATRNKTLNAINRNKQKDTYLVSLASFIEEGELTTDNHVAFNEFIDQVEKGVAKLPPKMREIFEMSRNSGFSHRQIAEKLSISDHTVKKSINRALKIIKTRLPVIFFLFFLK